MGVLNITLYRFDPARDEDLRREFEERHRLSFAQSDVVLNLSRQVPRKGLVAFLEHGFAHLRDDITLIIVGDGPELPRLREAQKRAATERILLLGAVDDETAAMLRSNAGLFIMPNVPLTDDVEG